MARLTKSQERLLHRSGAAVRIYIAITTFTFPFVCGYFAVQKYARITEKGGIPEIPLASTIGTITGIYLPLFAAVAAYIWAVQATPDHDLAPRGFAMALFRDLFTFPVMTVMLGLPILLYRNGTLRDLNPFLVWYQTVITAVAGAAFAYYFHVVLDPGRKPEAKAALTVTHEEPDRQVQTTAEAPAPQPSR